ncbi:MAG: RNA degradosome polyphosphate kinase, partial [Burkholderiales bacterium]|nr:RNA degradosome polyphosphate kinase [Anaerolineae bacterium]
MRTQIEPPSPPELGPETYTNRELSWLEFNRRVLEMAKDPNVPLLERVKFLAIFSTNMDEFYMVRVAGFASKVKLGLSNIRPDGLTPAQLIIEIRRRVTEMMDEQRSTMRDVLAQLEEYGVRVLNMAALSPEERAAVRSYFESEVFPVLTPLAVDHARPFPFISNLSLNLAVWL